MVLSPESSTKNQGIIWKTCGDPASARWFLLGTYPSEMKISEFPFLSFIHITRFEGLELFQALFAVMLNDLNGENILKYPSLSSSPGNACGDLLTARPK